MSSFGENYKKNYLLDDIQHYFSDGGTIEEMFDVLRYIFEYGKTPLADLIKENQELKKQLEEKENQQKEFVEWLEAYIEDRDNVRKLHDECSLSEERLSSQYFILQQVLSKYKEKLGGKDEIH